MTIEYLQDENKGFAYEGNTLIATLDFDTDVFEDFIEMTMEQFENIHYLITKQKEYYDNNKNYDVRAEQGLFGYGY